MNKYFTQHQVAVLGLCRLVCPPHPGCVRHLPSRMVCVPDQVVALLLARAGIHRRWGPGEETVDFQVSPSSAIVYCAPRAPNLLFFQPPFQRQAHSRARFTWPGPCNSWQVYSPCGRPSWGEVQAAGLGIHLSIAQVCSAVFTRRRVYSSKALTSEVHKGYGVELLTTGTIMGSWMTSQAPLRNAARSCT